LCTPKFIGISSDENNQGLNQNVHLFYFISFHFFFVGCAMSDSFKLSN
jgi:hypothetical protein